MTKYIIDKDHYLKIDKSIINDDYKVREGYTFAFYKKNKLVKASFGYTHKNRFIFLDELFLCFSSIKSKSEKIVEKIYNNLIKKHNEIYILDNDRYGYCDSFNCKNFIIAESSLTGPSGYYYDYCYKITKVRHLKTYPKLPKGYVFKQINHYYSNEDFYIKLFTSAGSKNAIGSVECRKIDTGTYETHSFLEKEYHGKGLGILLYAKAIQTCLDKGYKIRSSSSPSSQAQSVWNSNRLKQKFNIRKNKYATQGMFSATAKKPNSRRKNKKRS